MRNLSRWVRLTSGTVVLVGLTVVVGDLAAFTQTVNNYDCIDSDEATGPTFIWDDISTSGTALTLVFTPDDGTATVTIPWTFTFFGTGYNAVVVSANGLLDFGGTGSGEYVNQDLPNGTVPNAIVAAFWQDLHAGTGDVRWQVLGSAPNRRLVISWNGVTHYPDTSPNRFTFQVALYEQSSGIRIQYQTMADNGGTLYAAGQGATVGIENSTGTAENEYLFSGNPAGNAIANGLAIGFKPTGSATPWPAAAPAGPVDPTALVQSDTAGGPNTPGLVDGDGSVSFRGNVSHTNPLVMVQLQVEVKPVPTPFDGTNVPIPLATGNQVVGAGVSETTVTGLTNGDFKWRARTIAGVTNSGWVEYDAGLNPDFTIAIGGGGGGGPSGRNNSNGDSWINDSPLCLGGVPGSGAGGILWAGLALALALGTRRR
ncbi:MAG: hypothetical protein HYY16_03105 [Planctomycetes bacterium]|nr:hypothetical protein [Planctomycetota bacterium]